jgi:hypothetical protein
MDEFVRRAFSDESALDDGVEAYPPGIANTVGKLGERLAVRDLGYEQTWPAALSASAKPYGDRLRVIEQELAETPPSASKQPAKPCARAQPRAGRHRRQPLAAELRPAAIRAP